jgi:hypothetical protein
MVGARDKLNMLRTPLTAALAGAALLSFLSIASPAARGATVTYNIDSFDLNSSLGFTSGNFSGSNATQQNGSVSPIAISGTIVADRVGNTIQFLPGGGGVAIVANQSGNFSPGPGGFPLTTGPANFGLQGGGIGVAIRDLRFHPVSPAGPHTINASNQFAASATDIAFDDGAIDYLINLSQFGSHDIASIIGSVGNGAPGNASVTQSGGVETLLLPVRITLPFSLNTTGDSTVTFNGVIRATAVPEPTTAALLLAPLAASTLGRRRRV